MQPRCDCNLYEEELECEDKGTRDDLYKRMMEQCSLRSSRTYKVRDTVPASPVTYSGPTRKSTADIRAPVSKH
ncbi:unnamed protein product, partial [Nesidiocoris tenuis]